MISSTLVLLLPVLLYLLGAAGGRLYGWPVSAVCALLALLASAVAALLAVSQPLSPLPWLAATPLNLVMSLLVSLIGFIVVRFSVAYLAGDAVEARYRSWLQICLASVSLVVVTNHLLLLALAWSTISISLHQLLVSYPDRFRAVLAAHKKFIFARLAEICLMAAAVLLWKYHDTFLISEILSSYAGTEPLAWQQQTAALLLAMAALIKCAQLPVHGWLMQVVEAPTPVSALLHAGIINLGGYLMILMAPLISASTPARWLLLIVAGLTAVLAALIMMTRISIKVRLAWSTSAQMGLMLVECALGLHELALLHLVAHSCYKANAFLGSGNAVLNHLDRKLADKATERLALWLRNLIVSTALTIALLWLLPGTLSPAEWSAWLLVIIALSLWLPAQTGGRTLIRNTVIAAALLLAYLAQKALFASLLPASADAGWPAAIWTMTLFVLLLAGYGLLIMQRTAMSYRWRQWLFAGLYLDEWVTRTTLKLWPMKLPVNAARKPGHLNSSWSE
ncbi:NADH-quinone oxidoreductase subunit L [Alcanivorax sp. 1008]|uniref:NADH-quinone oxidoreductase subunit L n=1 Tax=Alcanivorax sp. 1008 TaxID=2816853 RepID=UPI001D9E8E4E|nr:NADH-quinone oxidoreductase subunit L [Alcanivorax sp. 1008]MCC1495684.1 NADH-quinone oxidoreductase subunit L [Alcanivorax sp. 1008]